MIITDEKLLRRQCEPVLPEEAPGLIALLEKELKASEVPGIGLAAPQIGVLKRAAIVRIGQGPSIDLINCEIEKGYDKFIFDGEGCLSYPKEYVKTERFYQVKVVNNLVSPYCFSVTGLAAIVVQHEIDHWYGRLLPDLSL